MGVLTDGRRACDGKEVVFLLVGGIYGLDSQIGAELTLFPTHVFALIITGIGDFSFVLFHQPPHTN